MSHEERIAYLKSVFDSVIKLAEEDPKKAGLAFLVWLKSPIGAIAWVYVLRNEKGAEFARVMKDITYNMLKIIDNVTVALK